MGSARGVWGGSLTLRCQHLIQQKMQSPRRSRRPKIPPSTMAKSFGQALVNTGDKTGSEREKEREMFQPTALHQGAGHSGGPQECLTAQLHLGLTLGPGEQGRVHRALTGCQG